MRDNGEEKRGWKDNILKRRVKRRRVYRRKEASVEERTRGGCVGLIHPSWTPTLYFSVSKVFVRNPTSFFLFSPTNRAATWAGSTFSRSRRFRFSRVSISSCSVRFLFFSRKSCLKQDSFCEAGKGEGGVSRWPTRI